MAYMEILEKNIVNTITMITQTSSLSVKLNLIDKNIPQKYVTIGYTSNTSCIVSIEFGSNTVISHILLQKHNMKGFRFFYDSVTANSLGIYAQNSDTSTYLNFASITVSSLQLQIDSAITADTEKYIGEMTVTEKKLTFDNNPSIDSIDYVLNRKQIKHEMPDGGITLFNIRDKFKTQIELSFISQTFYNSLLNIFEGQEPVCFALFPTTTSWDGRAYEVVWSGNFDFKYSHNVKSNGYSGKIVFEETASR